MQSIFKTQLLFKIDTKNTQLESNKKDCIRTMQSLWNSLEFNYGKDGFRAGTYQFLMRIDYSISIQKNFVLKWIKIQIEKNLIADNGIENEIR